MIIEQKKLQADLYMFLIIIAILLVAGTLFIYSASSIYALERFGSSGYFLKKHFLGLALSGIAFCIGRWVPLHVIKKMSPLLFLGSLCLTALTLFPKFGQQIHGSSRWFNIAGFSFQPSELLKMAFIMYLAYFLSKKEYTMLSFKHGYLPFLIILGATSLVLLRQPDFGLTVTLCATAFAMLFVTHINVIYVAATAAATIPLIIWLVFTRAYRLKRIMTFMNPWDDPQGAGFQVIQSLIAVGSGSFWGSGISHSKQKFFYLPMQHTDFIFSIIAEESGFLGTCLLIVLYLGILFFGLRIAWRLKDSFCSLIVFGFTIVTSLQALINISVALGLLPTKGIGLPFVSYGNSWLLVNAGMLGLIVNCVYD